MKKILSILLVLVMLMSVFSGCAPANSNSSTPSSSSEITTRTLIDATGRKITVPAKIDRIAIISTMPLCSVYCMAGGDPAKIVGLTPSSKNAAVNSFLNRVADLDEVSSAFAQSGTVNVEEVMNLNPDVVFYNAGNAADSEAVKKLESLGVPCVGFSTAIASTIETVSEWATTIGNVLGTEMAAGEIVKYGKDVEEMVAKRVASIPENERRSAIILTNYNAAGITVAGATFGRYWLSTIGAKNMAISVEQKTAPVSLEQIYDWNPDVIFLNSFSAFTPEQIASGNAVAGHDWSGLAAVANNRLYKMPLGMYYWFPPCSDSPLALQWLAKKLYPELFEDIDMDKEIKDYFLRFYKVTLTDEDLKTLYNPPAESAM